MHVINFESEIKFRTARSGGKGGQNVNKVETSVEALWQVASSVFFTAEEKAMIAERYKGRINTNGFLSLKSSEHRSQWANKKAAITKMLKIVNSAIRKPRKRIATQPSKKSKEARLSNKKMLSEKKSERAKRW